MERSYLQASWPAGLHQRLSKNGDVGGGTGDESEAVGTRPIFKLTTTTPARASLAPS
jgi:hypothetical protein